MQATTKPSTVDEYIADFPADIQKKLKQVRDVIRKTAPEAQECISYGMPAYKLHGPLVYFGGFKTHVGFYATPTGGEAFKTELSAYKVGKGSIQFPLDEPLPLDLIRRMVEFRVRENLEKAKKKAKR